MQNINPSSHLNRRGRFYALLGVLIFFGGLISVALGVLIFFLPLLGTTLSSPAALCLNGVGLVMVGGGGFAVFRGLTLKKDNPLAYEVGEAMRSLLGSDPRYTFVRNLSRQGLGYIDAVLVGPPGALVFRTVDYGGEWINERVDWRNRIKGNRLRPASTNPTRECARDVYALRKFLANRRLEKVPVYGVVVFTKPVKLSGQGSIIPIAEKHLLYPVLSQNYLSDERISNPQIRAAVDALIE